MLSSLQVCASLQVWGRFLFLLVLALINPGKSRTSPNLPLEARTRTVPDLEKNEIANAMAFQNLNLIKK